MQYLIALDQGTTSSRAIVFDQRLRALAIAQKPFAQLYPQAGWVEHDPYDILDSQLAALAEAYAASGISARDIAAISVANQRETALLWDKRSGKPLANAVVWQCRRSAAICERLRADGYGERIRAKTGLLLDAYFSAGKLQWLLDHIDGAREAARRGQIMAGTVESWLIWNLSGGAAHISDHSNASRTMLFDVNTLSWDEELCELFGIPPQILPRALPNDACYGVVNSRYADIAALNGVTLAGSIGDQQAALLGQGCWQDGDGKNTYGTGCFTLINCGGRRANIDGLLDSVGWSLGGDTVYAAEGSVFHAGSAIQWLRDGLGLIGSAPEINQLAAQVPDNGGVYMVPAFTGLGAPYWDMYARAIICGLTRGSTKAHIARATLEAIAYQVRELLDLLSADGGAYPRLLKADGGAANSDLLLQFQADILQIAVQRSGELEATARGAAICGGLASGLFSGLDSVPPPPSGDVFQPQMSKQQAELLFDGWRQAVRQCRASGAPRSGGVS